MTPADIDSHIRRRPSVHQLCVGAFLQQAIFVTPEVLAVPLLPVGFNDVAQMLGHYVSADLKQEIKEKHVDELRTKGKDAFPTVAFVWHPTVDAPAPTLVPSANPAFDSARQVLAWVTGEQPQPVAVVALHTNGAEFQVLPPGSRRRQRLWFSSREADGFQDSSIRLSVAARDDSNLGLALELFHDAVREVNGRFRIVRLYNVLECLATKHKAGGVGSRDAVRSMLQLAPGQSCKVQFHGTEIAFDIVSIAGRLRDKVMHGAEIREDAFAPADRPVFQAFIQEPFLIAFEMEWRIELEISRRAAHVQILTRPQLSL